MLDAVLSIQGISYTGLLRHMGGAYTKTKILHSVTVNCNLRLKFCFTRKHLEIQPVFGFVILIENYFLH
jgi:hypothetical protein